MPKSKEFFLDIQLLRGYNHLETICSLKFELERICSLELELETVCFFKFQIVPLFLPCPTCFVMFSICYIKESLENETAKTRKRAVTKRSQKEPYR